VKGSGNGAFLFCPICKLILETAMITPGYVQTMARYNTWQNENIFKSAAHLSDADRKAERGAFFGSIHATLNHVLWADQMWLWRFDANERPAAKTITDGLAQFEDWDALRAQRSAFDAGIETWARGVSERDLSGDLAWLSGGTGQTMTTPRWVAITHVFNHQTHHRGQVHALLTGFGVKPGLTDLPFGTVV
jgi:uncharacterized damage-inducible protein DinB